MEILTQIANIISYVSLAIIAYGSLIALFQFIGNELRRFKGTYTASNISVIRLNFGYYLLIGLEFLIASDIIHTILNPDPEDLAVLGGIVVIRTLLTFFLNKEIQQGKTVNSKNQNDILN